LLYACDKQWWDVYQEEVKRSFKGQLWTWDKDAAEQYGLSHAQGEDGPGLGRDGFIRLGGNSGYQLVNLVYFLGAVKLILLGYDMQRTGGQSHHHGDHPANVTRCSNYPAWIKNFRKLAEDLKQEDVEVLNASRATALDCFPKVKLEDIL
jgi:hypothetical protein